MGFFKYFWKDIVFTAICLFACFLIAGPTGLLAGAILGVFELSNSFDNAVVNAKTLGDMAPVWQKRFVTWGMLIAVVFMRLIFPILIVSVTSLEAPWTIAVQAIKQPDVYAAHLSSAHTEIMGFGGAFLAMIFFEYFFDAEKDTHWISLLEKPMVKVARFSQVIKPVFLTFVAGAITSTLIPVSEGWSFFFSAMAGIATKLGVDYLGDRLGAEGAGVTVAKSGIAGFIYLEIVDASFSFDGVIGAFAISNEIFIIALGLGIGAMAVRTLTLLMVEKGTLSAYRYLEPAAMWAIGALFFLMFFSIAHEVSEVVTGLVGAGIIAIGVIHSIIKNRSELGVTV